MTSDKMTQEIGDFEGQKEYLSNLTKEEMTTWLKDTLIRGNSFPIPCVFEDEDEMILYYHKAGGEKLRQNIEASIAQMISDWHPGYTMDTVFTREAVAVGGVEDTEGAAELFSELLYIAEHTGSDSAVEPIVSQLEKHPSELMSNYAPHNLGEKIWDLYFDALVATYRLTDGHVPTRLANTAFSFLDNELDSIDAERDRQKIHHAGMFFGMMMARMVGITMKRAGLAKSEKSGTEDLPERMAELSFDQLWEKAESYFSRLMDYNGKSRFDIKPYLISLPFGDELMEGYAKNLNNPSADGS